MENENKPKTLIAKLAEAMAEMDWVKKRGKNKFFNYEYATESDILGAIRPELAKRGVWVQTLIDSVEERETGRQTREGLPIKQVHVRTRHVFHDGDSDKTMEINGYGVGEDTGDKGVYKAVTGAVKYAFSKNFLVSTGDDPEGDSKVEENQEAAPKNLSRAQELGPLSVGKPFVQHQAEQQAEEKPANVDLGSFEDKVKSARRAGQGTKDGKAWTLYKIETEGHGELSTFDQTIFDAAQVALTLEHYVMIDSEPTPKGPKIVGIRSLAEEAA